jgi:peptidoglycan/xylan/chitin deacetylase (PgdA/CDA1 family)
MAATDASSAGALKAGLDALPLLPANRAPLATEYPWPDGAKAAMFLSFDVDAESAWTAKDPARYGELVTMSFGGYEARVGTPKLLQMLRELGLKATFFITGWSVEAHPAMCEAILKDGHEIGHHGFHHVMPQPGDPMLVEEVDRGLETLKRRLGVVPTGYRAPSGEFCEELRVLLKERGLVYTSSFRDDVRPYRHLLADDTLGLVELPVTASYDDWLLGLSQRYSRHTLLTREQVLSLWTDELAEIRDWGGMVTTVLHPQCSGRPMRLRLLRDFLQHAQALQDVWIATGAEIADHFIACEANPA